MLGTRDLNTSGDKTGMRGHGTQRQTGSFSTAAGTPRVQLKTTGQTPTSAACSCFTSFWGRRVPASLLSPSASPMLSLGRGRWQVWVSGCPRPPGELRKAELAPGRIELVSLQLLRRRRFYLTSDYLRMCFAFTCYSTFREPSETFRLKLY